MHESQMHSCNSFLTLTYDEAHLPEDKAIDVKHWQNFAKKLRRKYGPFRFYHIGEYGSTTFRPHYHAIIFGLDFAANRRPWGKGKRGDRLYVSKKLDELWGLGAIQIGNVTPESTAYVARYLTYKVKGDLIGPTYHGGRTPPYSTMSRRPGIGKTFYQKFKSDIYPHGYCIMDKGLKQPAPKYYDNLLRLEDPGAADLLSEARSAAIGPKQRANNTAKRLAVRETVHKARVKSLNRMF